jgi:hypothetical protein
VAAGNLFDVGKYVILSNDTDKFSSEDVYSYKRSLFVKIDGVTSFCQALFI